MIGNPDRPLTIDTHHHILPDFFWQATENGHAPVGGLTPLQWPKEASISFMDDAGIDVAVVSLSTPGVHTETTLKRGLWRAGATNSRPNWFIHDRTGLEVSPASPCRMSMPPERSFPTPSTSSGSMALFFLRIPTACASETLSWSRFSKNWSAAKPSSMCIPIRHRMRLPMP